MKFITNKLIKDSNNIHKEIKNDENSSYNRWLKKEVLSSKTIFTPSLSTFENVSKPKTFHMTLNNEFLFENSPTIEIKAETLLKDKSIRPNCGVTINFPKTSLENFNRISIYVNIKATGFQNFYYHFKLGNTIPVHTESIKPNMWTRVIFELEDDRDKEVDKLTITPFLFGCPPEAESSVSFFIGKVVLEEVKPDYVKGWDLENRIAYSHVGYLPNSDKIALTSKSSDTIFYLLDLDNEVVYQNKVKEENTSLGKYYILDFTNFTNEGIYKLALDERTTNPFEISEDCFTSSIIKSINFLRCLRCGEDIDGVHSACHLNCRTVKEDGSSVPNFGGWHDAGDVSQFEIPTSEMASALMDLANKVKDKDLKERLLEEARVGVNWLLRTRFSDGYRALAVSYNIWRKNELESDDKTVSHSVAEIGPFESFLSSATLAIASRSYTDPIFTDYCKRIAISDFDLSVKWYEEGIHTKRWGSNIDSQVSGAALTAACELYTLTKDKKYIPYFKKYADIIMSCQETTYLKNSNIRGFFYEDPLHKYILTYEHRGHEQSPIQGLCRLINVYPEIDFKDEVINAINLYKEYIINTIKVTKPYNLLPGHVYNINKLNLERFTIPGWLCTMDEGKNDLINQIKKGIKINDDGWYLRIFPVAVQRRGYHATLLSKTKGLSLIYQTLKDPSLYQIIIDQLEWIFGKNPFSSSTMYGEGYNYHKLYVAYSNQITGALPVGIMTKKDDDEPYWPTFCNAVFKEIWGHTTGKYLHILADLDLNI